MGGLQKLAEKTLKRTTATEHVNLIGGSGTNLKCVVSQRSDKFQRQFDFVLQAMNGLKMGDPCSTFEISKFRKQWRSFHCVLSRTSADRQV